MEKGILYGVGIGPGDPELVTLKAVRCMLDADVIAAPSKGLALRIALGAAPELREKETIAVDMPMTKDPEKLEAAYAAGADRLAEILDQGKTIAFLTLGDPTVYSTYVYLHKKITARGYETHIIPGVTSFCAAAAELGISLCENGQQLHIIPGTYEPEKALELGGVKVMMKNNLPKTLSYLKTRPKSAAMVENCGLPNQHVYHSLDEIPEDAGYFSLLIVKDGAL